MSYEKFKEFHGKHPDLDNQEYYAEFPETNKSTIRSWKTRARKPIEVPPPEPTEEEAKQGNGYEEEYLKLLCTQTGTPYSDFEGVDSKSAILILKNRQKGIQLQELDKPSRASNSSILPAPAPIGQGKKKFGLDQYIEFDGDKNEIRMEIPWDVLFDPEKNRALGERK